MSTIKTKYTLLASCLVIALSGCALEGDDGDTGATGAQGPQGPAGEDGQNAANGISLSLVARTVLNPEDPEGAAEIVQYDTARQQFLAINSAAATPTVEIMDAAELPATASDNALTLDNLTSTALTLETDVNGKTLQGANSIAVHGDWLAVAMEADHGVRGEILFYELAQGTATYSGSIEAGFLPDMVTFTPDGTRVLVANEGEPNGDYSVDPEGSITVITLADSGIEDATVAQLDFQAFNGQQADLAALGMHFPNPSGRTINGNLIETTVAQDLEPEYITATNDRAYVTLQENNGLAVVDLSDNSIEIVGLGFKDWSSYQIDTMEDGTVSFGQYDNLKGVYMPDSIAHYQWNNATFLVTANEGDAREYFFDVADEAACTAAGGEDYDSDDGCLAYTDEAQARDLDYAAGSELETLAGDDPKDVNFTAFPLGRLTVTKALGDTDNDGEYETLYAYGSRSFTIWDQNGLPVFDSGDDFERITASVHGNAFNNNDDENEGDSRSSNKGPEPEALTLGQIGSRTYAFIGLERMGGIMVYDVTNPYNAQFVDYVINRDLTEGLSVDDGIGDLAPEGMVFVPAADSATGKPLLVVGNEVSGSVSVWQISSVD
ncbi:choice-of-anchor I family protein [Idiomarina sp. UBA3162]|uniref:choice-of-anchor I family protein n=1 Tax=Idiomarina sp. UBA3162 TaxID=1946641 RepID=UPI000C955C2C|nr:choice-of-anchor I family protein [Idiomarina sp. UBA3162]MAD52850.1 alkaline phosphatase [Idiomarinaceae bacterium]